MMEKHTTNEVSISGWVVTTMVGGLPSLFNEYLSHAGFVEKIDLKDTEQEGVFFVGVRDFQSSNSSSFPSTVIAQRYSPSGWGFTPGVLLVPETSVLFLGAGTRVLAYNLQKQERIWEDYTLVGFWGWEQHGNIVLMLSELELTAWNTIGEKLWSKAVEPPWSFSVQNDQVWLGIMGCISHFDINTGH